MQRTNHQFQIQDIAEFKNKLLNWAQQFKTAVWLDSNNYQQKHSNFDAILAVDAFSEIEINYSKISSCLLVIRQHPNKCKLKYILIYGPEVGESRVQPPQLIFRSYAPAFIHLISNSGSGFGLTYL